MKPSTLSSIAADDGKMSPVYEEVARLERGTGNLHARLAELEDRLVAVLRPKPPQDECGKLIHTPPCPLAEALFREANCVEHAIGRVNDLLDRLAV